MENAQCLKGCIQDANPAAEELGGMASRPSWEVLLGRLPGALLGFLEFHSSVILIFPPLKPVSIK